MTLKEFATRAAGFAKRNGMRNTGYLVRYAVHYFDTGYRMHPSYLSESALQEAMDRGRSLIRLGDGEAYIINYGSIHYQDFDSRLRTALFEIVRDYSDTSPYLLGIPKEGLGQSNTELARKNLLGCWLPFKVLYERMFNHDANYFDAHLFYRSDYLTRLLDRALAGKKVILVTNRENFDLIRGEGIERRFPIVFVECPSQNAFSGINNLHERVIAEIDPNNPDEYRVLLSAGPASKVLAYWLSTAGITAFDIGKGIETLYRPNEIEKFI